MFTEFITEYFGFLTVPDGAIATDILFLLSVLVSSIMAYIPIHLIIKPIVGEKIARYSFIAVLVAMLIFLAGSVGVFVGV